MVLSLPLLSCESPVSVKVNHAREKINTDWKNNLISEEPVLAKLIYKYFANIPKQLNLKKVPSVKQSRTY